MSTRSTLLTSLFIILLTAPTAGAAPPRQATDGEAYISGEILLTTVKRAPADPICCPGQQSITRYRLQQGKLVEQ